MHGLLKLSKTSLQQLFGESKHWIKVLSMTREQLPVIGPDQLFCLELFDLLQRIVKSLIQQIS
jgi:hypothetical protein